MHLNLQESLATALGWVTGNFAGLESGLDYFLWLLLFGNTGKGQRRGKMVTAELSFQRKIWLFEALAVERLDPKYHPEVKALVKQFRKVEKDRNRIIHSLWIGGGDGTARRFKHTAKGKLAQEVQKLPVEEVQRVASSIDRAMEDIHTLYLKVTDGASVLYLRDT